MKRVLILCFLSSVLGQTFDTSLEVPGLGRSVSLGALYDARTDKIVRGFNPWKQQNLEKNILEKDGSQSDHCMIVSSSFDKKADALDVGLSVKASFLTGKIQVGGAANYLKEKSQSNYEAEVGFRFRQFTHTKEITMAQLDCDCVDYPNVFDRAKDATHFVAKIQYGVNAVFQFSEMSNSIEGRSSIQTKLSAAVKFVYGDVDASAHLDLNSTERKEYSSFSCKYMGDVALKPPTTFLEAVETYKTLPSLVNKDIAQPLTIELLPISRLDSKLNRVVRQIETNLLKDVVERMDQYDDRQEEIGDLRLNEVYPTLSLFRKQIENYQLALTSQHDKFQSDLSDVLPKVRETVMDEDKLENALDERQRYVTMEHLERWSYWKERETGALTPLASWNPKLIVTDKELEKIKSNNSIDYIVTLALHIYPKKDLFTECAQNNCGPNGNGNKICPSLNCANNNQYKSWIQNNPLKSALRSSFGRYQRIINLANEIKPTGGKTVYFIREEPFGEEGEKISMELYTNVEDSISETEFQLPKINIGSVEGNATRRLLKWNVTGSTETMNLVNKNQYIVQYRPLTRLTWKKLVPKQNSVLIPCAVDFEVAVYVMCTFGVCGVQNTTIRAKQPPIIPLKILLMGGEDINSRSSMEYYYPVWPRYDYPLDDVKMLQPRCKHTSVVDKEGNIMTIGGYSNGWIVNKVEIFNPNTNIVTQGNAMTYTRQHCASAVLDEIVYVCGGYHNYYFYSSCERYRYEKWDTVADMNEQRQEFVMVSLKGYIYAIGGFNGHKLDSVEKYSPDSNTWVTMPTMNTPRQGHGAAVLQDSIYVCGGTDDRSCEKYDFSASQWINIAQMISVRGKGMIMISDAADHLFAFGGSADSQITAEMYCTNTSIWTQLKPLAYKRRYSTAVIIE